MMMQYLLILPRFGAIPEFLSGSSVQDKSAASFVHMIQHVYPGHLVEIKPDTASGAWVMAMRMKMQNFCIKA